MTETQTEKTLRYGEKIALKEYGEIIKIKFGKPITEIRAFKEVDGVFVDNYKSSTPQEILHSKIFINELKRLKKKYSFLKMMGVILND